MKDKVKLYPYKCFEVDNSFYMFTSKNNRIIEIERSYYDILKKGEKQQYFVYTNCSEKLLSDLREFDLIYKSSKVNFHDNGEIFSIVLMTAQSCNLSCEYCYGESGEYHNKGFMNENIAKAAIDYLISHCGENKKVYVTFFGGEPLLNMKLIRNVVEYIEQLESEKGISIGKSMTTNGTLLTDEISDYCYKKRIAVKVSIDGPEIINNQLRKYKNGEGTFNDIVKNSEKLITYGFASARATITPLCLDRMYIEDELRKLGYKNVSSALADELFECEDYLKLYEIYSKGLKDIEELIQTKQYDIIKSLHIRIWGYLFNIHKSAYTEFNCGSGRNLYAIDINGDIYPCHRFVGNKQYKLGNVINEEVNRKPIINQISINSEKRNDCKKCWLRDLCLGMCPYTYFIALGKEPKKKSIVCALNKVMYENAIRLYVTLTDEDKDAIFKDVNNKNEIC